MNESELILRASRGDEVAWVNIIRQHQEVVFRLAYLMLGNGDDAEDVAQEVFIRAFRGLDGFDRSRPLRPWLLEITRNQAHNWRRAVRRRMAALTRWQKSAHEVVDEPADQMAMAWQAATLWQAVRQLHGKDREIIYLRCFLELPVEETAQALNIATGTVKSRLSRALTRLHAMVEQDFPDLREEVVE